MQNHPGATETSRYHKGKSSRTQRTRVRAENLVSDVPGQQHPHGSAPCWTLHFQLVLGIVGEAVNILHGSLLPIPAAAEQTPSHSQHSLRPVTPSAGSPPVDAGRLSEESRVPAQVDDIIVPAEVLPGDPEHSWRTTSTAWALKLKDGSSPTLPDNRRHMGVPLSNFCAVFGSKLRYLRSSGVQFFSSRSQ